MLGVAAAGCGGSAKSVRPEHPRARPPDGASRAAAVRAFGKRVYDALADGKPQRVLLGDVALRQVLEPEAATRVSALRAGMGARLDFRPRAFGLLREAEFTGVCVQSSREEPAASTIGLREPGWVFERMLVVGEQGGGRRVASWVEGTFVYTNAGFAAIDLRRVEEPRWEHSALELAPCDLKVGLRGPLGSRS
jgi:hypothetical protein